MTVQVVFVDGDVSEYHDTLNYRLVSVKNGRYWVINTTSLVYHIEKKKVFKIRRLKDE